MEIQSPLVFTIIFLSLISLIIVLVKRCYRSNESAVKKLPPNPWKLPLIGHLHHLSGGLPHHVLRRLSDKYGPVFHLQLGTVSTVVVSSREAAENLLKIQDPACTDRAESIGAKILWYNYADIVFSPYNEYWRQMRKLLILEMLSVRNVRSFASIRQDEASHLVKSIVSASGQPVNITEKVFAFTCSITCRTAFGDVIRDWDAMVDVLKGAVELASGFQLADFFPCLEMVSWSKYKLTKLWRKLDAIVEDIVKEHRLKQRGEFGGEDMVDVLLRVQQSGELSIPITDDNIKAIIFDMYSAGSETSSTATNWAMAELMRNPRIMEKAQAEIRLALKGKSIVEESDVQKLKYLQMVIKEALRMHPPFPLLLRACKQECHVDGYTIPPKTKVMFNVWGMGRDPKYWDEPDSFRPERFENSSVDFLGNNFEFLPFGAGKRICPGINFGLANVALPLAQLLYYFDWKMPNGMNCSDIDMTEAEGLAVARKHDLILVPTLAISPSTEE